jgi:nitrite reductase/ring-hydroxylating ferredoxin subunit
MLHEGTLEGMFVTCPMHGWTFCLADGMPKTGNGRAKIYQVKVEGENVLVAKPEKTW